MHSPRHRQHFADTDEGKDVKKQLKQMAASDQFSTVSTYTSNSTIYPDNLIPFVDKHINYLIGHPSLDANQYLANIKLMTRVRKAV